MIATINNGTEKEISWKIDEQITPELINHVRKAGKGKNINWTETEFAEPVEIILNKYEKEELKLRLYDEDPDLIEMVALILQTPENQNSLQNYKDFVRLYLPVIIILVDEL